MRLSTKGRYAVMAMADLAKRGEGRAVTLGEIATRQDISLAYLEQLFSRLRKRGLVQRELDEARQELQILRRRTKDRSS